MKKIWALFIVILLVYPLSVFLQLLINWISGDYHLFWVFSEISKKNLIILFISDWQQAAYFILPTVAIIYVLNQLLHTINKYILPLFVALITLILCYSELPSAFSYIIIISFLLINIQFVTVTGAVTGEVTGNSK